MAFKKLIIKVLVYLQTIIIVIIKQSKRKVKQDKNLQHCLCW